jgi:hypothetical protein
MTVKGMKRRGKSSVRERREESSRFTISNEDEGGSDEGAKMNRRSLFLPRYSEIQAEYS